MRPKARGRCGVHRRVPGEGAGRGFHGIELHLELVSMGHHVLFGAESCDGCQYDVRYVSQITEAPDARDLGMV